MQKPVELTPVQQNITKSLIVHHYKNWVWAHYLESWVIKKAGKKCEHAIG